MVNATADVVTDECVNVCGKKGRLQLEFLNTESYF